MPVPTTIWSARRWMQKKAWTAASAAPASMATTSPSDQEPNWSARVEPEERPHQHHPLEADVHDAASLGEEAAHGCERERRRVAERCSEQHRPGEDEVEVAETRLLSCDSEAHADDGGRPPRPSRRVPRHV